MRAGLARAAAELRGRLTWRLLAAAACIGAASSLAAAVVRLSFRGLQWMLTGSAADLPLDAAHMTPLRRLLTPVVGALLATAVIAFQQRRATERGAAVMPYVEYVEAVRREKGRIPLQPNLLRTLAAAFSVATGAAVGREGSMIQFAATVASLCGRGWRSFTAGDDHTLPLLVACGVAGGVTAAYNAPLAGVCFAMEIVLGAWCVRSALPMALAALLGSGVSGLLLGRERLYPMSAACPWCWQLAFLPLLAVVLACAGPAYQKLLSAFTGLRRVPGSLLMGGLAVGLASLAEPRVWGNGDEGLRCALGLPSPGAATPAHGLLALLGLRLAATLACVWVGTIGGVFTPTLFAGAACGALLAGFLPGPLHALFAVAGMSCFLAAVTHAPLMAACIAVELTGDWKLLAPLIVLNLLSWRVARRLSGRALYAIASQAPDPPALWVHAGNQAL